MVPYGLAGGLHTPPSVPFRAKYSKLEGYNDGYLFAASGQAAGLELCIFRLF